MAVGTWDLPGNSLISLIHTWILLFFRSVVVSARVLICVAELTFCFITYQLCDLG